MNGFSGGPGGNGYGPPSPYGVAPQQQPQQPQGYGPPQQAYGYGAPQQPYGQPMYPQPMYGQPMYGQPMMGVVAPKNSGLAIVLELAGGTCFQTFGVGHLYAGNVGMGLGLMFGYWFLTFVNVLLCSVLIGFVTWPLTWIAFMIISAVTANNAVKEANTRAGFPAT